MGVQRRADGGLLILLQNTTVRPHHQPFNSFGISVTADGVVIAGNFIGTDAAGTQDFGNLGAGVRLDTATNGSIGGTTPEARNVISGNDGPGILVASPPDNFGGNLIQGNLIGTNKAGTAAVKNQSGIRILSFGNTVGGSTTAARNVISGNAFGGVIINDGGLRGSGNVIQNNFIGLQADGIGPLGNGFNDDPSDKRAGIHLDRFAGTGNAILSNGIAFNAGLGID